MSYVWKNGADGRPKVVGAFDINKLTLLQRAEIFDGYGLPAQNRDYHFAYAYSPICYFNYHVQEHKLNILRN